MSKPKFKTTWFYAPSGEPRTADYDEFSKSIENAYNEFDADGYDVVNIIPLAVGSNEAVNATLKASGDATYLGQVGFSVTRGAIIVGKLRTT